MTWNQFAGKWKQVKGSVKQRWGMLTDDDLEFIAGRRERLAGKLQERYGLTAEEAEKSSDEWLRTMAMEETSAAHR